MVRLDLNGDIASRLGIASKTVRNHASNIFAKLHVTGRVEATIKARDQGFRQS